MTRADAVTLALAAGVLVTGFVILNRHYAAALETCQQHGFSRSTCIHSLR